MSFHFWARSEMQLFPYKLADNIIDNCYKIHYVGIHPRPDCSLVVWLLSASLSQIRARGCHNTTPVTSMPLTQWATVGALGPFLECGGSFHPFWRHRRSSFRIQAHATLPVNLQHVRDNTTTTTHPERPHSLSCSEGCSVSIDALEF